MHYCSCLVVNRICPHLTRIIANQNKMAHHAMPFLVVNYGAEMIFILDQRLQAQNISPEKSSKVLHDVIKAMFSPTFVDELLRPQPLYTPALTKEIFDRLAHSSIMRLSENSMDKLYDLMTMGCKYQYVTIRHPYELVEVTLNHLENVRASLTSDSEYLKGVESRMHTLMASLTVGTLADCRLALLNFFQSKRVKVSLFLQEGMQNSDATLNIPPDTCLPPLYTSEPPGTVRYFDQGAVVLEEVLSHPDAALRYRTQPASYNPFDIGTRQCTQGTNLYLLDRKKKAAVAAASAPTETAPLATTAPSGAIVAPKTRPTPSSSISKMSKVQVGALNSLSSLIGGGAAPTVSHFKLSLFDDQAAEDAAASSKNDDIAPELAPVVNISKISKEEVRSNNAELMGVVNQFDLGVGRGSGTQSSQAAAGGVDDLLDLMDHA
jgi:hypothetical protein